MSKENSGLSRDMEVFKTELSDDKLDALDDFRSVMWDLVSLLGDEVQQARKCNNKVGYYLDHGKNVLSILNKMEDVIGKAKRL